MGRLGLSIGKRMIFRVALLLIWFQCTPSSCKVALNTHTAVRKLTGTHSMSVRYTTQVYARTEPVSAIYIAVGATANIYISASLCWVLYGHKMDLKRVVDPHLPGIKVGYGTNDIVNRIVSNEVQRS
jgi:hypothetical protein